MTSVLVKWPLSTGEHFELTINDVYDDALSATDGSPCESLADSHSVEMYIVKTNRGVFVLCRRCCKKLGLPI